MTQTGKLDKYRKLTERLIRQGKSIRVPVADSEYIGRIVDFFAEIVVVDDLAFALEIHIKSDSNGHFYEINTISKWM